MFLFVFDSLHLAEKRAAESTLLLVAPRDQTGREDVKNGGDDEDDEAVTEAGGNVGDGGRKESDGRNAGGK